MLELLNIIAWFAVSALFSMWQMTFEKEKIRWTDKYQVIIRGVCYEWKLKCYHD